MSEESDIDNEDTFLDDDDVSENDFSLNDPSRSQTDPNPKPKVTGIRHLLDLKATLGLEAFKDKKNTKRERKRRQKERRKLKKANEKGQTDSTVTTLASRIALESGKQVSSAEVVQFEDPRKRSLKRKQAVVEKVSTIEPSRPNVLDEITLTQARFDVFKFSLSGMDKADQQEARVAHAIRLGAKAPKKPCLPYADLKTQRKATKEEAQKRKEYERATGLKVASVRPSTLKAKSSKNKKDHSKSAKKSEAKSAPKGKHSNPLKLGKFDGGMLKLSSKDIAKLKS